MTLGLQAVISRISLLPPLAALIRSQPRHLSGKVRIENRGLSNCHSQVMRMRRCVVFFRLIVLRKELSSPVSDLLELYRVFCRKLSSIVFVVMCSYSSAANCLSNRLWRA